MAETNLVFLTQKERIIYKTWGIYKHCGNRVAGAGRTGCQMSERKEFQLERVDKSRSVKKTS